MSRVLVANLVSSISELKRSPGRVIEEAADGAVAILNRNKPVAYVLDPASYERMLDLLEDYEDMKKVIEREGQPATYVTLEQLDEL